MLLVQQKPKTLYGVHQRTPLQVRSSASDPTPRELEFTRAPKRVSWPKPWSPLRRPLQGSRGASRFALASSARAEVRGARRGFVGLAGRHTEDRLEPFMSPLAV